MARYYQRNNKWQVIIELGIDERTGKRLRHTKDGFKTKREALAYATVKENELLNGINPLSSKVLLKDFITDWYDNHISKTLAINTKNNYRSRIDTHIIPYLGNMQLSKIKVTDIQKFYYHLMEKDMKSSSAKKVIQALTNCFKYAKKLNMISSVPTDIEYFKDEKDQKIKVWDEAQLTYFLNEINEDYLYMPVLIASLTGIRIGELCGLRWENTDLDNNQIYIKEQVIQDKENMKLIHTSILKTSRSNRNIYIPPILVEILKEIQPIKSTTISKINDFVILNRDGGMSNPRNISMEFTKRVSKFKDSVEEKKKTLSDEDLQHYLQLPPITFHGLRHTHATILLLNGENIKVISKRLGHTSTQLTWDTYSHVLPVMEERTANLLEDIFKSKLKVEDKK